MSQMNNLRVRTHPVSLRLNWIITALDVDKSLGFEQMCRIGQAWRESDEDLRFYEEFQDNSPLVVCILWSTRDSAKEAKADFLAGLMASYLTARKISTTMAGERSQNEEESDPSLGREPGSIGEEDSGD